MVLISRFEVPAYGRRGVGEVIPRKLLRGLFSPLRGACQADNVPVLLLLLRHPSREDDVAEQLGVHVGLLLQHTAVQVALRPRPPLHVPPEEACPTLRFVPFPGRLRFHGERVPRRELGLNAHDQAVRDEHNVRLCREAPHLFMRFKEPPGFQQKRERLKPVGREVHLSSPEVEFRLPRDRNEMPLQEPPQGILQSAGLQKRHKDVPAERVLARLVPQAVSLGFPRVIENPLIDELRPAPEIPQPGLFSALRVLPVAINERPRGGVQLQTVDFAIRERLLAAKNPGERLDGTALDRASDRKVNSQIKTVRIKVILGQGVRDHWSFSNAAKCL